MYVYYKDFFFYIMLPLIFRYTKVFPVFHSSFRFPLLKVAPSLKILWINVTCPKTSKVILKVETNNLGSLMLASHLLWPIAGIFGISCLCLKCRGGSHCGSSNSKFYKWRLKSEVIGYMTSLVHLYSPWLQFWSQFTMIHVLLSI